MMKVELQVDGMSCGHCLAAVRGALESVPGAEVGSVQIGRAVVGVPDGGMTDALVGAVEEAGYNVSFTRELSG